MVITRIKLATVLPKAILHAITAANKVICLVNVRKPKRKGHVINAGRPVTGLVTAQKAGIIVVVVAAAAAAAAWEAPRVRNATNVGKWDILRVTAARAVAVGMEAATAAGMAEGAVTAAACEVKLVTLVEAMVICREIAHKVKNVTIVSGLKYAGVTSFSWSQQANVLYSGGEVGHLSRDCPSEASSERVCYKCKEPGHLQAACPA